jgi:hypothetical protein
VELAVDNYDRWCSNAASPIPTSLRQIFLCSQPSFVFVSFSGICEEEANFLVAITTTYKLVFRKFGSVVLALFVG